MPASEKKTFWHLRDSRKHCFLHFDVGQKVCTFFIRVLHGAASAYLLIIDVFAFIVGEDFLPVGHRFVFLNKGAR